MPMPATKLITFATNVSKPANTKAAPMTVDPMYPAERIVGGCPPWTMVQPPRMGSIHIRVMVPPDRTAWPASDKETVRQWNSGVNC